MIKNRRNENLNSDFHERQALLGDKSYIRRRDVILAEFETIDAKEATTVSGMLKIIGLFLEVIVDIRNNTYGKKIDKHDGLGDTW